ncbi:30S ribosomal protein S13 [Aeromicrobium flavum]|uniref:30S ribosomal protein S13 n=1 Tax=Aeromicrobium flavum TaxID=416568 RepID=A0A512HRV7_9ACTN|nr:integration host factor, actinobacterial type [Aeromicrobium flavum]GEO88100.1 30S ribosomal protein S13 [Aeromicrobium flavum]
MALPRLTDEQRREALAKAAVARQVRAEVKNRLRHSGASVAEVLKEAQSNEAIAKIKVLDLLQSIPGIGKLTAQQIMDDLNIAQSRRLRGLGSNQAKGLIAEIARRG